MKAMTCNGYGPADRVFELKTIPKPIPKANEVLIKILATVVTSGDCKLRGFRGIPPSFWLPSRLMFGLRSPRQPIWGLLFSGEIEQIGKDVKLFKEGDQVYGSTEFGFGTYAQYKCLPETACISKKPENLSHEETVSIPFGLETAIHFLRKANIEKGQKVLIYGASGAVGTAAVQLAKHYGAEVTGVCSTTNMEMVKSLGADYVIDYTKEDFTENGVRYDIIFETVGKKSYSSCKYSLQSNGYFLMAVFAMYEICQMLWRKVVGGPKVICSVAGAVLEYYDLMRELAESGKVVPVIDRCYSLEEIPQAHIYVEGGHKKGNVVIKVDHEQKDEE
ncbi:unnamed protein product [Dimorphilus gyrociliatus]|uniref:Enoyl reductase (ER) domain-containing protein n=1 Tax=Dimorphilus gyrociliatus TaxID=2664684 RepID=A0A7I8V7F7_9ANNE|nr:unnamed protein product [Dimorphilus gyrociliatus]